MNIIDLPEDILRLFQNYVSPKDWRNLLTALDLKTLKKQTMYLQLDRQHSLSYYENYEFRSTVLESINLSWSKGINDIITQINYCIRSIH